METIVTNMSATEVLKESGLDKNGVNRSEPALTEEEHLKELCVIANYLIQALEYYGTKYAFNSSLRDEEKENVLDNS